MTAVLRRTLHAGKAIALWVLYYSGFLRLLLAFRLRRRAVVLTYHRVLPDAARDESFSADQIIVTPETFQMHMQVLKRYLQPLAPEEFAATIESGRSLPPGSCLVTFDDGWWDNIHHALPILEQNKMPAVVFVATDYIGSETCFWQERLARLLFVVWQQGTIGREYLRELGYDPLAANPARARRGIREFVTSAKSRRMEHIEELLAKVESQLRTWKITVTSSHSDRFMSWDDVASMARSQYISIGSHCCSHTPLTKLDEPQIKLELEHSRHEIESRIGMPVCTLAYPNGDCNDAIAALVDAAGYQVAFTTQRGHVGDDVERLRICRINIQERSANTPAAFLSRLAGIR